VWGEVEGEFFVGFEWDVEVVVWWWEWVDEVVVECVWW